MALDGVTEEQHSSWNHFLHSEHSTQSSPGNDSDQNPSHIGHCASTLSASGFFDFFAFTLAFLAFFGLAGSFCFLLLLCSIKLSRRDCLYGELAIISDSSDCFDFFFSVMEGSFNISEKLTFSDDGSPSSGTGGKLQDSVDAGTGSTGAAGSITEDDSVDGVSVDMVSSWMVLCVAEPAGECKLSSEGDANSASRGSSMNSDEGNISGLQLLDKQY